MFAASFPAEVSSTIGSSTLMVFCAQSLQLHDGCTLICYVPRKSRQVRDNYARDFLVIFPAVCQHLLKLWSFIGGASRLLVNKHFQLLQRIIDAESLELAGLDRDGIVGVGLFYGTRAYISNSRSE